MLQLLLVIEDKLSSKCDSIAQFSCGNMIFRWREEAKSNQTMFDEQPNGSFVK